jgi:hypothetical protein
MKNIVLNDGFTVTIDENVADDMELLDDMIDADEGDPIAIARLCTKILGKEEKKRLYDHLRDEHRRVPVTKVVPVIVEIITGIGKKEEDGKNS